MRLACICDFALYVTGICGLSGVMILGSYGGGDINGTFCNDGTYSLPLNTKIYRQNIIIVQYGLTKHDFKLHYTSIEHSDDSDLISLGTKEVMFSWRVQELRRDVDVIWNFFKSYHYSYKLQNPVILVSTYRGLMWFKRCNYIVLAVKDIKGNCLPQSQTKSLITILFRHGNSIFVTSCVKIIYKNVGSIHSISIAPWLTEVISFLCVSLIDFAFTSWVNIIHIINIIHHDQRTVQDLYQSPCNESAYQILGPHDNTGIVTVNNPANYLRISLANMDHRFAVRGWGSVGVGSNFGMSIHMQFNDSKVEYFYVSTAHVFHMVQHKIHISSYLTFHYLTFVNITYIRWRPPRYSHWGVKMAYVRRKCEIDDATPLRLATCTDRIRCGNSAQMGRFRQGSYNVERDEFTTESATVIRKLLYFGPVDISGNDANTACSRHGSKWVPVREIKWSWLEDLHQIVALSAASYGVRYWNVDFPYTTDLSVSQRVANCRKILGLYELQYAMYQHCLLKDNCTNSIHFLHEDIVQRNEDLFCSNSTIVDIPKDYCSVLVPNDFSKIFTLMYVPCGMTLLNSGYVCEAARSMNRTSTVAHRARIVSRGPIPGMHICPDLTYLPNYYVCDGTPQCPGGSDEKDCADICTFDDSSQSRCFTQCKAPDCACSAFYFQCEAGGCIPLSEVCDCMEDCADGSDELSYLCVESLCNISELQSKHGHNKCLLDYNPDVTNPSYYHIFERVRQQDLACLKTSGTSTEWQMLYDDEICDGHIDCLDGCDEWTFHCSNFTLKNSMRCPRDNKMVPFETICSGYKACKKGHDDKLTKFYMNQQLIDSEECTFKGLVVMCIAPSYLPITVMDRALIITQSSLNSGLYIRNATHMLILKIVHFDISSFQHIGESRNLSSAFFVNLTALSMLIVTNCSVQFVSQDAFHSLVHLVHFDLSHNNIDTIEQGTLQPLLKLRYLNLTHTHLTFVSSGLLQNNSDLKILDLSHTNIVYIMAGAFHGIQHVQILALFHILAPLQSLRYAFDNLTALKQLHVNHPEICCNFKHIVCTSSAVRHTDVFGTCQKILSELVLLSFAYVFVLMIACMNVISFLWHVTLGFKTMSVMVSSMALTLADGLMALYIAMIILAHHMYESDVLYISMIWKTTLYCKLCGVIIMASISVSNISTLIITADRFTCMVLRPYARKGFSTTQIITALTIGWITGLILPLLSAFLPGTTISNSVCILVGTSVHPAISITYTVQNVAIFVHIGVMCTALVYTVKKNTIVSSSSGSGRGKVILILVVATNFLASVTISVLSLLAAVAHTPVWLESLSAFILLPLNSVVNPLLYTILTSQFAVKMQEYCTELCR